MTRRAALVVVTLAVAVTGTGCGSGDASGDDELVVAAASSLKTAFTTYGDAFGGATVRYSFAGSDLLDAQLRQGLKPDVFAAANTELPDQLFADGLVERPIVFAGNRLVIAVPADADGIDALDDLAAAGVTIAAGAASVPVGAYTRRVLAGLPADRREAILGNVRSSEPDVAGVIGKLTQGAVDAGFVYLTDVTGTGGRLRAVELPAALRPQVAYAVAVVKGTRRDAAARAFVAGLLRGDGRRALTDAGFAPAPG